jgi:type I restriction enzyme S subunit
MKPGYKQTEVGVIPEEWEVKLLPEVTHFRGGKAHEQHISDAGPFVCVNSKFISTEGKVRKYATANFCSAKKGDVLMVMSDLPNGKALAKAFLADRDNLYAVNQRVCALTAYRDYSPCYLLYTLNRNPYFLKFDDGVSQTHLLNNVFRQCPLPLPPTLAEQDAIAGALSDADALIDSLEQLIAKKRLLKQGAMQDLLTGKKRLPGFEGVWEEATFSSKLRHHSGDSTLIKGKLSSTPIGGYYPGFSASGQDVWLPSYAQEGDALVVSAVGSRCGKCFRASGKWSAIANTHIVWPNAGVVSIAYLMLYIHDEEFWTKGGSGQPFVKFKESFEKVIAWPSLPEQTAIAEALTEMDGELAVLEQRREKTRALKQGMMQELLTGRTRLI